MPIQLICVDLHRSALICVHLRFLLSSCISILMKSLPTPVKSHSGWESHARVICGKKIDSCGRGDTNESMKSPAVLKTDREKILKSQLSASSDLERLPNYFRHFGALRA